MQVRTYTFSLIIIFLGAFSTVKKHAYTNRFSKAIQLYEQAIIYLCKQHTNRPHDALSKPSKKIEIL